MKRVYFKSFGRRGNAPHLESSIIDPRTNELSTCQTISQAIETGVLMPNTRHHGLADRLCASLPTPEFPGSYRPEGILFTTNRAPNYCAPVDVMALTRGKTFTHQDYGSDFLPGYERFLFADIESMNREFPNSWSALDELNEFRERHGLNPADGTRTYNEICFEDQVTIKPVSLVGESDEIRGLSEKHRIRRYNSISDYVAAFERKRSIIEMARVGSLATAAAAALLAVQAMNPSLLARMGEEQLSLGNAYFQK